MIHQRGIITFKAITIVFVSLWAVGAFVSTDPRAVGGASGCPGCSTKLAVSCSSTEEGLCLETYQACNDQNKTGTGRCCTDGLACQGTNCTPINSSWCYWTASNPCPTSCPPTTP